MTRVTKGHQLTQVQLGQLRCWAQQKKNWLTQGQSAYDSAQDVITGDIAPNIVVGGIEWKVTF